MNIYVGNLARHVTSDDLRTAFSGYGTVVNAIVLRDTKTGQPLGHGHVYLVPEQAGREAVASLNHVVLRGRPIIVRECLYRSRRDRRIVKRPWKEEERRRGNERRLNGHHISAPAINQTHAAGSAPG